MKNDATTVVAPYLNSLNIGNFFQNKKSFVVNEHIKIERFSECLNACKT